VTSALKLKNITKVYEHGRQPLEVLSPLSLSIAREEVVCIIGPNGSGKSTLLKIVAGIEEPTAGTLTISGAPGYVPQQPSLLPWRTVEQNLRLPGDISAQDRRQTKADIRQLLQDFGLLEFADVYPKALSGGMQQKVALLRAVLWNPAFLLLDEPFASLDSITRLEMQRWLLSLQRRFHSTILCVTHDIREAMFLADTIYVLAQRPGHIRQKLVVDLPRPRQPHHLVTAGAKKLEKNLYDLLVPAL